MSEPHLCGLEYGLVLDFCGHGYVLFPHNAKKASHISMFVL